MKLALSLLALTPALLVAQQASTDAGFKPITLAEAVALAQQNAPSAVQARTAIDNAEGTVSTTRYELFPTLSASLGHSQGAGESLDPTTGELRRRVSKPSYSTGLSTSLTIFDGGKRIYDLRARRADLAAAEVSQASTRFSLALQVKQQYYAILAAREGETAARVALDLAQQQLDAASARVRAGAAIISDSLRSFVALGNAQLAVMTAQNDVRNSSLALTRVVGSPTMVTAAAADTAGFAITPIDSGAIVALALDGPGVRSAAASVAAANAGVKSARASYYPTLSTSLNYNGSGYDKMYGIGSGVLAYGNSFRISASYNIWDGRTRAEALSRAQNTVTNQEAALMDARLLAQQNILTQISTLRSAEERIRIQQLSVLAAAEDLRVQQQRYSLGSSTILEVTTSQNALNTARAALIQGRLDYRIARAQIESIIGRDLQ